MTTRLSGNLTRFLPFNRGYEMGLLQRFVHVEPTPKGSKARPVVIFPRYHQWDAVRGTSAMRPGSPAPTNLRQREAETSDR